MKISLITISSFLLCFALIGCKPEPPNADFTATATEGEAPIEVQFTDQSMGKIDEWQWDFDNDGVVDSTLQNPRYTYNEVGTYSVSLTVRNSGGSDSVTKIGYIDLYLPCKIDFIAETTNVVGVVDIKFIDLSEGRITNWSWDFDSDGVVDSIEQNPTYSYTRNGDYTVTLTITGPYCELSMTKDNYIHVSGCSG